MTVHDIREIVTQGTTLWIQTRAGKYCEANEAGCLSHKWDDKSIAVMYQERYPAMGCTGITVVLEG